MHDGREVTLSEDPCLKCSCSNKKLTCMKKACPVLQCPPSKQIKLPGECCPRCSEKRLIKHIPGKCILGQGFHADGKRFSADHCSTCTCVNGTSICRRNTCPVLECAPEFQKLTPGECCPHCPPIAEAKSTCTVDGQTYQVHTYIIITINILYSLHIKIHSILRHSFRAMKRGIWIHAVHADATRVKFAVHRPSVR